MEQAITTIIDSGVLGALVILFGGVIVYQNREIRKLSDGRLQDSKDVTSNLIEPMEAIKRAIQEQGEDRKKENREVINAVDNSKLRRD